MNALGSNVCFFFSWVIVSRTDQTFLSDIKFKLYGSGDSQMLNSMYSKRYDPPLGGF